MNRKDYYEVLEIDRECAPQKIKEAYRRLALQYHPDRNQGDASAVERMKEINEAYAVLSDPEKRVRYDGLRREYGYSAYDHFRRNYTEEDIFRGSDIGRIFEEIARSFGMRGFEEVFRESYGSNFRSFEIRRPGVFGRGFVFSGPLYRGCTRSEARPLIGAPSRLLGRLVKYALKKMTGMELPEPGRDHYHVLILDAALATSGGKAVYRDKERSRQLAITIPAGIREGQKIRLRGMGYEGKGGGVPGDLYLKVEVRKPLLHKIRDFLKA